MRSASARAESGSFALVSTSGSIFVWPAASIQPMTVVRLPSKRSTPHRFSNAAARSMTTFLPISFSPPADL